MCVCICFPLLRRRHSTNKAWKDSVFSFIASYYFVLFFFFFFFSFCSLVRSLFAFLFFQTYTFVITIIYCVINGTVFDVGEKLSRNAFVCNTYRHFIYMYNKCDFELQNVKPEIAALTANELFVVFCVDFCVLVSNGYLYSHWFFLYVHMDV